MTHLSLQQQDTALAKVVGVERKRVSLGWRYLGSEMMQTNVITALAALYRLNYMGINLYAIEEGEEAMDISQY